MLKLSMLADAFNGEAHFSFDHARLGAKRLGQSLHLVGNDTIGRLGCNPFRHDGL